MQWNQKRKYSKKCHAAVMAFPRNVHLRMCSLDNDSLINAHLFLASGSFVQDDPFVHAGRK